jgi:hypothetical protein
MEESKEIRKDFIIVRDGKNWKVRSGNIYIGGTFTMLEKARAWIDAEVIRRERKEYNSELYRIRKIKDLDKRTKEYKKLCQTRQSS